MMSPEFITAVGSIPAGIVGMWLIYKLASNHVSHNTEAIDRLKEAIEENTALVRGLVGWLNREHDGT